MPKVYRGINGGVYYKKAGKKVYLTPSQKESLFGSMRNSGFGDPPKKPGKKKGKNRPKTENETFLIILKQWIGDKCTENDKTPIGDDDLKTFANAQIIAIINNKIPRFDRKNPVTTNEVDDILRFLIEGLRKVRTKGKTQAQKDFKIKCHQYLMLYANEYIGKRAINTQTQRTSVQRRKDGALRVTVSDMLGRFNKKQPTQEQQRVQLEKTTRINVLNDALISQATGDDPYDFASRFAIIKNKLNVVTPDELEKQKKLRLAAKKAADFVPKETQNYLTTILHKEPVTGIITPEYLTKAKIKMKMSFGSSGIETIGLPLSVFNDLTDETILRIIRTNNSKPGNPPEHTVDEIIMRKSRLPVTQKRIYFYKLLIPNFLGGISGPPPTTWGDVEAIYRSLLVMQKTAMSPEDEQMLEYMLNAVESYDPTTFDRWVNDTDKERTLGKIVESMFGVPTGTWDGIKQSEELPEDDDVDPEEEDPDNDKEGNIATFGRRMFGNLSMFGRYY